MIVCRYTSMTVGCLRLNGNSKNCRSLGQTMHCFGFWILCIVCQICQIIYGIGFLRFLRGNMNQCCKPMSTWMGPVLPRIDRMQKIPQRAFIVILECDVMDNDFGYRFFWAKSHALAPSQGPRSNNQDVGELLHDSLTTEAVAMIWSLAWAIQSPFQCHTCFHYDNMTIGPFAAGDAQWKCSWEYQVLKRNLLTLRHFLHSIGKSFSMTHEKAHVGQPWSEAVDTLAKATAKRIMLPPASVPIVSAALRQAASSFAWMLNTDLAQIPKITALRATFKAEGPFENQPPHDQTWWHSQEQTIHETVQLHLGFATANVLALDGGKMANQNQGLWQLGRIATLQAQFCRSNCTIIGLQECRTSGSSTRHSASHLVYQSGADSKGVRGCELWLDTTRPYASSKKHQFHFEASHIHVASFDDRHLLAVLNAPHLQLRILVLHAPHNGATDVTLTQWWHTIQEAIQRTPGAIPLVVLGDMNARFGSHTSEAVSHHQAEEENETGHHAHSFLLDNSLWAPSTFSEHHEGDATTWISPSGHPARLDFVFIPITWKDLTITSRVNYDIDLALARHDHFVVSLEVSMSQSLHPRTRSIRCRIDTRKCQDAQACSKFQAYMATPPQIAWSCGVGQHAEEIIAWIQTGALQAFAQDKRLPRQ